MIVGAVHEPHSHRRGRLCHQDGMPFNKVVCAGASMLSVRTADLAVEGEAVAYFFYSEYLRFHSFQVDYSERRVA